VIVGSGRRRASSALFVATIMAASGAVMLGAPAAARGMPDERGTVRTVTVDRWVPTGLVPVGAPFVATAEAPDAGEPAPVAPRVLLRTIVPATDAAAVSSGPVLLVAEHSPQNQWDAWTANGFAVAHLRLPTAEDGCIDRGGPADLAAMKAALAFLDGSGPGFADRAGTVEAEPEFSDHRVAAVGDAGGGSPLMLGASGVSAVVATNAVVSGYDQQGWLAARPSSAPDPECVGVAPRSSVPATEPWWRLRDHLPRKGYAAPTLVVQSLGADADVAPAQGIAAAAALGRLGVPAELHLLTAGASVVDADSAIDAWLSRFVLDPPATGPDHPMPGTAAPAVLHRGTDVENLAQGPYPDAEPAGLSGTDRGALAVGLPAAAELALPLRTDPLAADLDVAGAPVVTARFSSPANLHLDLIESDGTTTGLARGTVEWAAAEPQQVTLSALDVRIPVGSRLQVSVVGDQAGVIADLTVDIPVRGGVAALTQALPADVESTATSTPATASSPAASPSPTRTSVPAAPTVSTSTAARATPASATPAPAPSTLDSQSADPESTPSTPPAASPDQSATTTDEPVGEPPTSTASIDSSSVEPSASPPTVSPAPNAQSPMASSPVLPSPIVPTSMGGGLEPPGPAWADRGSQVDVPRVLSMSIEDRSDPVDLQDVALRGVDTAANGRLHPVRVLDPGVRPWNLTGQVSDFRSAGGTILADNLGWRPTVTSELGQRGSVEAGPSVSPGSGSGLGAARVLCSGAASDQPAIAMCGGELRLGVPGSARPGEYTALLTLTLI
jgi:hypothetical protein